MRGLVLLLGDQPGVTVDTIRALVAARRGPRGRGLLVRRRARATRCGSIGACSRRCAGLHGDKAVWKLVDAGEDVVRVLVPGDVPRDVDTWDDYQALLAAGGVSEMERRRVRRGGSVGGSTTTATSPTRAWRPRSS